MINEETLQTRKKYFFKLFKASLLISTAPIILMSVYVIYERISMQDAIIGIFATFFLAVFFVRPYLGDLTSLTEWVIKLAKDQKADAPSLSFLSNVEELSLAVNNLHESWDERKIQLEAMLAESKILFDILPDVLIMLDKDLHVVRANSVAQQVFKANLRGKDLSSFISNEELIKNVKMAMETKNESEMELYFEWPMDQFYLAKIECFPVFSPGGIAAILIMHNITESKRSEQMFADFVANASHEIRTPLTSIIGFIETLKTTAKDDVEAQEEFLDVMAEQGEQMAHLVSSLLSLSKIEMNVNTSPTDIISLAPIIEDAAKRLQRNAEERGITIDIDIPEDLPDIYGDQIEVGQVFTNLISNAIKYGFENSTTSIKARIENNLPDDDSYFSKIHSAIAVSVTDQGEGIPQEHLHRLTERFYRIDSARSRKIGGTGLGLAIVKHILNRHRGNLIIESEHGVGSTFTVYFPLQEK